MGKTNTILIIFALILVAILAFYKLFIVYFFIFLGFTILLKYIAKKGLNLLQVTIMFMTVHTFLVFHFLPQYLNGTIISILAMWKDIIIFSMFIIILINNSLNKNSNEKDPSFAKVNKFIVLFLILCFVNLIISTIGNQKLLTVYLNGFRQYCFPYVVYFIARNLKHTDKDCYNFIRNISYFFIAIALFGIIQQSVFGLKFLSQFNYYQSDGTIASSFFIGGFNNITRLFSTFDGPNNYALFAFIPAVFFLGDITILRHRTVKNYIALTIIVVTIFLSFSRSSIISMLIAFSIILVMESKKNKKIMGFFIKGIVVISIMVLFVALSNNKYAVMMKSQSLSTSSLSDLSLLGHISSLKESLTIAINNPLGMGIGMAGPRAAQYFASFISSESSYFIIAFDLGIIGVLFFLAIIIYLIKALSIKCREDNIYISFVSKCCISIMIGISINYMFLPSEQDIIHSSLIYAMIGLVSNYHLKKESIYKIKKNII